MHNPLNPIRPNLLKDESQTEQSSWAGPPREMVEDFEKWTRYFSYACLAGTILLALTLVLIPLAAVAYWQYHVLKQARESFSAALRAPFIHPKHMEQAIERIGFQFLIQLLGLVVGMVLAVGVILIAFALGIGSLSSMSMPSNDLMGTLQSLIP